MPKYGGTRRCAAAPPYLLCWCLRRAQKRWTSVGWDAAPKARVPPSTQARSPSVATSSAGARQRKFRRRCLDMVGLAAARLRPTLLAVRVPGSHAKAMDERRVGRSAEGASPTIHAGAQPLGRHQLRRCTPAEISPSMPRHGGTRRCAAAAHPTLPPRPGRAANRPAHARSTSGRDKRANVRPRPYPLSPNPYLLISIPSLTSARAAPRSARRRAWASGRRRARRGRP
jgi:hypothetical protein